MLTIVTVNWNSYDWLNILLASTRCLTNQEYKVIVIDNSINTCSISYPNVCHIINNNNIGHGEGLNMGVRLVETPYTMFVDVDCHFLLKCWDDLFYNLMKDFQVIAGRGVMLKPIRPACLFMQTDIAKKYDWKATPGYKGLRGGIPGTDVAIQAYYDMVEDNISIKMIESKKKNRYNTLNGEEWQIDGQSFMYHHWHGSHLKERQVDFPNNDLLVDKYNLFKQLPWISRI